MLVKSELKDVYCAFEILMDQLEKKQSILGLICF